MGGIYKASLEGLELTGNIRDYAPWFAFFWGFWFHVFVACSQNDPKLRSNILKGAVCMVLLTPFCFAGLIWNLKWACAARDQSTKK